jgi:hypothetical protein
VSSPRHDTNTRRTAFLTMAGEMDVDVPEQRGEKRLAEETDVSGPPKPKRIKVGYCQAANTT